MTLAETMEATDAEIKRLVAEFVDRSTGVSDASTAYVHRAAASNRRLEDDLQQVRRTMGLARRESEELWAALAPGEKQAR